MKKRIEALLLCCAMALTLLTGCGSSSTETTAAGSSAESSAAGSTDTADTQTIDMEVPEEIGADSVSYVTDGDITLDTVLFTLDGEKITAGFYFYWLAYYTDLMEMQASYYGQELDLAQESDGVSAAEYLKELAMNATKSTVALEKKLEEYGLSLTDEEAAEAQEMADAQSDTMLAYLCTNADAMSRIARRSYISSTVKDHLYSEGGELEPTAETVADYEEDNDIQYVCRYILCYADTDATDEEKEEAKSDCETIYSALKDLEGDELLTAFEGYQEDNPDGNTDEFTVTSDSSLVDGFTDALDELEVGEIGMSDLTDYGYFVLLRLDGTNSYITDAYSSQISEWADALEVTNSSVYDELDALTFCEGLIEMQAVIDEAYSAVNADSSSSAQ